MSTETMIVTPTLEGGRISTAFDGRGKRQRLLDPALKSDWWRRVSAGEMEFFVDYGVDLQVPDSVAVIPALMNVLPLAWLTDTTIVLDEIDEHLAAALPFIKARYRTLYPELEWAGKVEWRKTRYEQVGQAAGNPLSMFSGGVDAVFTALANLALQPTLVTVWGADMFFHDPQGWDVVRTANRDFADRLGLQFLPVTSSFRTSVNYSILDIDFGKRVKDNWWHAFQFGPSLGALGLPIAFAQKADTIFLASDYSKKDPFIGRSASDAALVQEIRAAGMGVKCHDFNVSRQDKVRFICEFGKTHPGYSIPLRVCWQTSSGKNCGVCEKCMRTQFAIMGCGGDPAEFGFDMSDDRQDQIIEVIRTGKIKKTAFWREIVKDLRSSKAADAKIAKELLEAE